MGSVPTRRPDLPSAQDRPKVAPTSPYEVIAAKERQRIIVDDVLDGSPAPTVTELAARHGVSVGTAHRALGLLKEWGLVARTSRGVRPVIIRVDSDDDRVGLYEEEELATVTVLPVVHRDDTADRMPVEMTESGTRPLQLEIKRNGAVAGRFVTTADPMDFDELRRLLVEFLRRKGHDELRVGEFEMDVRVLGSDEVLMTFVA
jgi:DNA-binding transcriptional regulator YhcF (GntR family)